MNRKLCAPADRVQSWESINWKKAEDYVKKLQMRIVKAQKSGHCNKVKTLQWLLTHSFYAKALAVKRVTSNKGKNTAGVDHELWKTPKRGQLVHPSVCLHSASIGSIPLSAAIFRVPAYPAVFSLHTDTVDMRRRYQRSRQRR